MLRIEETKKDHYYIVLHDMYFYGILLLVYYITGNHENWLTLNERTELLNRMEEAGVHYLNNESVQIEHGGAEFHMIGLDDANLVDGSLERIIKGLDTDRLTVLLAHEPQYSNYYSDNQVDLVLSGHAHVGQIRLPFIGGLVAPDQGLFPHYTAGEYRGGDTTMIVSRGLGNSILPLRIFNFPEIVYIELSQE